MLSITLYLEKNSSLFRKILNIFRFEVYWRERMIGALTFIMYMLGNMLEIFSSPHPSLQATTDPPVIWITGALLSLVVAWISLTRFKQYTTLLFTTLVYFVNFNIVLSYFECTIKLGAHPGSGASEPSVYLFTGYFIFFITSQMLESRRELFAITAFEIVCFGVGCYWFRSYNPSLLQANQQLMLFMVMVGNYTIGVQRLRLTQISGDSSIQFKAISENARDVQGIINSNFDFLYINPSIKELTGFVSGNLTGKKFITLVAEHDQPEVITALHKVKDLTDEKQSVEYRIQTSSNTFVWVESIFSRFKIDQKGRTDMIFVETRNIEARKKLEEEIQTQLRMEELLIKHSSQFINLGRTEIQHGIDVALGEFGGMLKADALLVYRMFGKIQDEFCSTNQWTARGAEPVIPYFNLSIKINQQLVSFLRSLRGEKASHGGFFDAQKLFDIQAINTNNLPGRKFFLVPLQSGNIVNGFVVFVFDNSASNAPLSFYGLTGNMVSNAFTRMRTEMRLHEAQQTNESILRALPDWLYIINKKGEFIGSNNASTLPDYIPDFGLIGRTFEELLPGVIASRFTQALNEVIETEVASSFEYLDTFIHKERYFKAIVAPFKAGEFLVIIRDITDLKLAQNELMLKAKKLEHSNKELEEFAYVVSHDMKQPIRTVISYLTLLKKKHAIHLAPEAQEFVNFSIEGANKMSDLIRDILQYSRLDQQITLANNVSLENIVKKVCKGLTDTIVANNATVDCGQLPAITGNETMLTELFQNLIENGIKYNLSPEKHVQVSASDRGDEWLFEIVDNGIGFDQVYAQQIFKIFKRLHTDGEFQGTGIGLTICQKVVEKHGGIIWAESEKGKGSHFFFTLPKEKVSVKNPMVTALA
jgi:PAS domain S-box-containing protein